MKNVFLYLMLAASVTLMSAACTEKESFEGDGKDEGELVVPPSPPPVVETLRDRICGEWHYCSEDGMTDIYLFLASDGVFELYQKFEAGVHHLYGGTWTFEAEVLDGVYNDGTEWYAGYTVSLSDDNGILLLDDGTAVKSYSRTVIPDSVKNTCIVEVKSRAIIL